LHEAVERGGFREDLLARINLWTFRLPGLAERREDIAPNLDFELERITATTGRKVTMNKEARERFLSFAESPAAKWSANFRDLGAAITRMATLAGGGRITVDQIDEEIARLQAAWEDRAARRDSVLALVFSRAQIARLDLFDREQLETVVRVCRESKSLSDAGRTLFAISRQEKKQANDADRLRKYLARFGLGWSDITNNS